MFCEKCGNQIADSLSFCPKCGNSLSAGRNCQTVDSKSSVQKSGIIVKVVEYAILVLIVVGYFAYKYYLSDTSPWQIKRHTAELIERCINESELAEFVQFVKTDDIELEKQESNHYTGTAGVWLNRKENPQPEPVRFRYVLDVRTEYGQIRLSQKMHTDDLARFGELFLGGAGTDAIVNELEEAYNELKEAYGDAETGSDDSGSKAECPSDSEEISKNNPKEVANKFTQNFFGGKAEEIRKLVTRQTADEMETVVEGIKSGLADVRSGTVEDFVMSGDEGTFRMSAVMENGETMKCPINFALVKEDGEWRVSPDDYLENQRMAQNRSCKANAKMVENAAEAYMIMKGVGAGTKIKMSDIMKAGLLKIEPTCPISKKSYTIAVDSDGCPHVTCDHK